MDDSLPAGSRLGPLLLVAVWFGIVTGLVEGLGLLLFQKINWENWGTAIHVSWQIIWISPLVDVLLFLVLALLLFAWSRLRPNFFLLRAAVFLFATLAVYGWLTVTQRLYQAACILLALGIGFVAARCFTGHQAVALRCFKKTGPWLAVAVLIVLMTVRISDTAREHRIEAALPPATTGSPNVLVIIVDTLRADHVSAYGYSRNTTPVLDRVASEGVLFENAISPSSWSLPTHVSLVTGRYLHEHGWGNIHRSPWLGWGKAGLGGYPTIGEAFQNRGYRTAAFSANRTYFVANLGYERGFQHFEDYFHSPADMFARTLWGTEILRNYGRKIDIKAAKRMVGYGRNFGIRKLAQDVNTEFFHWIDKGSPRPFLAFFNYLDVHYPYGGPPSYPKPDWDLTEAVGLYDAGVKYVDDNLGLLMRGLEQRGLAGNTIIVVTSDHGESLWQHGIKFHISTVYRELIQVPLVVWFPGHVPAGRRISRPVSTTAIPATLLGLAGTGGQEEFPGPPLTLLWTQPEKASSWPYPLAEVEETIVDRGQNETASMAVPTAFDGSLSSIVTPQWHFITHTKYGDQLYSWVRDPGETHDLINTPEGEAVAPDLKRELEARTATSNAATQAGIQ